MTILSVCEYILRKILEIKWRKWLTYYYIDHWLNNKNYYYGDQNNPDQRISEDVNEFVVLTINIAIGFIKALFTLVCFIMILWILSDLITISFRGYTFHIEGILVWTALLYAIVSSFFIFKLGSPLINLNYYQQETQAFFRSQLLTIKQHKEQISSLQGESSESKYLKSNFLGVFNNFIQLTYRQAKVNFFTQNYNQIAIIIPFLIIANSYFNKAITLGMVMQISAAFSKVQSSFSFFITLFPTLASWKATSDRLIELHYTPTPVPSILKNKIYVSNTSISLKNVVLYDTNNKPLLKPISTSIAPCSRVLIHGKNGIGKTVLIKTLTNQWPNWDGVINAPDDYLFIPHNPYLPYQEFIESISYPNKAVDLVEFCNILDTLSLGVFKQYINQTQDWNATLSLGEQQKLMFVRLLISQANTFYLDEITASIEPNLAFNLFKILFKHKTNATIINISHQKELAALHTYVLNLQIYS